MSIFTTRLFFWIVIIDPHSSQSTYHYCASIKVPSWNARKIIGCWKNIKPLNRFKYQNKTILVITNGLIEAEKERYFQEMAKNQQLNINKVHPFSN